MPTEHSRKIDLRAREFITNPYALFKELREEGAVHYVPQLDAYWLMRHADCDAVLNNLDYGKKFRLSSNVSENNPTGMIDNDDPYASMLILDPPRHTRLRLLVSKAFTPKNIERLRPFVEELSDSILQNVDKKSYFDLMEEFAGPIPAYTIARMMGVPNSDMHRFKELSDLIVIALDPTRSPEDYKSANEASEKLRKYFSKLIEDRRKSLGEDILSDLIRSEESGDKLSHTELLVMCNLLLVAGHETTTNLIGNGFLALLRNRDQLSLLQNDRSLLKTAVEEFLRYDPPVQMVARGVYRDSEFSGEKIAAGKKVVTIIGSANRDPEVFQEPEKLDITRKENKHLSFSKGIHYCLGAQLARLEAEIAFDRLCDKFQNPRLFEEPEWGTNVNMHGMKSLKIKIA